MVSSGRIRDICCGSGKEVRVSLREWWDKHGLLTRSQAHEIAHRAGEQAVLEERRWLGYGQGDRESNIDDPVTFAEAWQWAEGAKIAKTLGLHEAADFDTLAARSGWIMMGLSSAEDANRVVPDGKLRNLQDAAFEKAQNNPHAKGAVKAIRKYVAGRGVAVSSPVKEVNDVIQDFWLQNDMNARHKAMVRSVYIEGEYFCLYSIHPGTGQVTMRRIPPKEITGIETDPEDIENVWTYQRQFLGPTGAKEERYYADIDYYRTLAQAKTEGLEPLPQSSVHDHIRQQAVAGDVLVQFIRWGEEGEKRGRVPMAAELPYFKMMEQINQDAARRCHEQAKVIWLKKITGRTGEATTRERRAPAGGVMLVETDSVSYRSESPKLAAGDMETVRLMLIHTIGAGLQIPDVILDSNADTQSYASIKKSDTPFLQEVLDWQDFWDDHLRVMLSVPIRAAIEAKRLQPTITINRFVDEAVWDVVDRVIEGVIAHVPMSEILSDVKPLLEGKEETVTIPTEEAPISIIFPILVHESPLEQAQALQAWQALGVSNQTIVTKLGLDWKEELANRKAMQEMEAQAAEEQMAKFGQGKTPEPPGGIIPGE